MPGRGIREEAGAEMGPLAAQMAMEHVYRPGSGLGVEGLECRAKELDHTAGCGEPWAFGGRENDWPGLYVGHRDTSDPITFPHP